LIQKYYKYRAFDEFTDRIITNSSLYYASPHDFNDPFDCQLSFRESYSKKEIREFFIDFLTRRPDFPLPLKKLISEYGKSEQFINFAKQHMNKFIQNVGIVSLSKNYNNILMWSHYADNHKGLVFEFSEIQKYNKISKMIGTSITYKNSYDLLSYTPASKEDQINELEKLFLTKHNHWIYEEEFRLIDFSFQGEKEFPKEILTSIIFGLNTKQSDIDHMIQLCKDNGFEHVKFKKAQKAPGKFALEFIDIT